MSEKSEWRTYWRARRIANKADFSKPWSFMIDMDVHPLLPQWRTRWGHLSVSSHRYPDFARAAYGKFRSLHGGDRAEAAIRKLHP